MMEKSNYLKPLTSILFFSALILNACTETGGGGSSDGESGSSSSSSSGGDGVTTRCGAIANGTYKNPISANDGVAVRFISTSGPNLVVVQSATSGPQLVRLHGVASTVVGVAGSAQSAIERFSVDGLFFVSAGSSCVEATAAGQAQIGSLFNSAGAGLAEALAAAGVVRSNVADTCGGDRIGICLKALEETPPPETVTAGELARFLWKPQSDSDGKLAVQTAPFKSTIVVNGETGTNQGSGNGYGSLARFSKSGCAYGSARVKVLNSKGLPFTVGGQTTFTVSNGCGRFCVEDSSGKVVSCSN